MIISNCDYRRPNPEILKVPLDESDYDRIKQTAARGKVVVASLVWCEGINALPIKTEGQLWVANWLASLSVGTTFRTVDILDAGFPNKRVVDPYSYPAKLLAWCISNNVPISLKDPCKSIRSYVMGDLSDPFIEYYDIGDGVSSHSAGFLSDLSKVDIKTIHPATTDSPEEWMEIAACRQSGVVFRTNPVRERDIDRSLGVCANCAVKDECGKFARKNNIDTGIWAGDVLG
jgi:hypothetical protein